MSDISITNQVKPLKIGVRFKPPAFILWYERNNGLRKRTMPVRGLLKNSSARKIAKGMKEHHEKFLCRVPNVKIEKLLRIIQENMKGKSIDESLNIVGMEFNVDPNEDLNKLDDETLSHKKEIMDLTFEENRRKPDDPDFQYDIQVDFSDPPEFEKSTWDVNEDDGNLEF